MSERVPKVTVIDLLNSIDKLLLYTKGKSYEEFIANDMIVDAVIRNIEVMGEAANRLPDNFIHQFREINWNKIIATRNRLIHGYDSIENKVIWDIIVNDIPKLKAQIEELLERL